MIWVQKTAQYLHCMTSQIEPSVLQETEPLDIVIVRRGQRSTGEAFILLRMPMQVDLVLRKDKSYIGKRYVEVTLAKKLVSALLTLHATSCVLAVGARLCTRRWLPPLFADYGKLALQRLLHSDVFSAA